MRIGLLSPSIYMHHKYQDRVYAPGKLAVSLANSLEDLGVKVYFFTSADVKSKATIVSYDEELVVQNLLLEAKQDIPADMNDIISLYERKKYYEIGLTTEIFKYANEQKINIIHSYNAISNLSHYFLQFFSIPSIFTLHTPAPLKGTIEHWRYAKFSKHNYCSISNKQREDFRKNIPDINIIKTIYHGLNTSDFAFNLRDQGYLSFIGRMSVEKGIDLAIQTAIQTDIDLKIAAPVDKNVERNNFYQQNILPYLNHPHIKHLGFLDGKEKFDFLKNAKVFLFPLKWEEPFGMVLIESMACGTPIIAFNKGSIPEIVVDGKTGFIVDYKEGIRGLIKAVLRLYSLPSGQYEEMRLNCRKHVEENFTEKIMAQNHIKLYENILRKNSL